VNGGERPLARENGGRMFPQKARARQNCRHVAKEVGPILFLSVPHRPSASQS